MPMLLISLRIRGLSFESFSGWIVHMAFGGAGLSAISSSCLCLIGLVYAVLATSRSTWDREAAVPRVGTASWGRQLVVLELAGHHLRRRCLRG
jgi:hypothetical protein